MRKTASLFAGLWLLIAGRAFAQPTEPNERVVRAEAPIVAGNAVNAKKRALNDAFRQAVERAFAELVKDGASLTQPVPTGLAQLKASLANSSQKFIRSYRIIEQDTEAGMLRVMVEAEIDTVALRREIDRVRGAVNTPTLQTVAKPVANFMLVAGGAPIGTMMVNALTAVGLRVQLDQASTEPQLLANAAKQNAYALFVTPKAAMEGTVQGTTRISVKCNLDSRVFQAGIQVGRGPSIQRADEERGFAQDEATARNSCFERAAATAARELATALRIPMISAPFVTVQLDIVGPSAIPMLLQMLKRMGGVTATEVRHMTSVSAELRVFTRIGGSALQQAVIRELGGKFAITPMPSTNDLLALRLRSLDSSALEENR
jgi:hypothetical protein